MNKHGHGQSMFKKMKVSCHGFVSYPMQCQAHPMPTTNSQFIVHRHGQSPVKVNMAKGNEQVTLSIRGNLHGSSNYQFTLKPPGLIELSQITLSTSKLYQAKPEGTEQTPAHTRCRPQKQATPANTSESNQPKNKAPFSNGNS